MAKRRKRNRTRSLIIASILAVGLGLLLSFGVLRSQSTQSQAATNATTILFSINLHGIGAAGDAANPMYDANMEPLTKERSMTLYLISESDQMSGGNAHAVYDSNTGSFKGEQEIHNIASGRYTVKASMPKYLDGGLEQPVDVVAGERVVIPAITLIAGDANEDKKLDVSDYNIIIDCLELSTSPRNCDTQKKDTADVDDDGKVTQYDYNLFLREIANASTQADVAVNISPSAGACETVDLLEPVDLTAETTGIPNQYRLSWAGPQEATSYYLDITKSTTAGGINMNIENPVLDSSYLFTAEPNSVYTWSVQSRDDCGNTSVMSSSSRIPPEPQE